ncbi:MAG: DUF4190 domain-containing protein [Planctomycetota bacterium]
MSQMTPPPEPSMPDGAYLPEDSDRLSQAALWSMILGIIGLCVPLTSLPALIMGIVGLTKTGAGKLRGQGFAVTGTVLGALGLFGSCLWLGIMLPAVGKARLTARTVESQAQLRQIALGMNTYHDEFAALPPTESWRSTLSEYLVGTPDDPIFTSPISDGDPIEYVFVADQYVFDGARIMLYEDPDHRTVDGEVVVAFDDGSVRRIPEEQLEASLRARGFDVER